VLGLSTGPEAEPIHRSAGTRTTGRHLPGGGSVADVTEDRREPRLEHVRWVRTPDLREPVVVAGFAGWSDAGDAATVAARYLADQWGAEVFATIDPEAFYDFTTTRPRVQFDDRGDREIVWPENQLLAAEIPGAGRDAIILIGVEPQLRWRSFAEQVTGVARQLSARRVLTFGALLAEVPHARPVSVFGVGHDREVARQLSLLPSRYEGPTGITGVLQIACRDAGLPSASLWAAVPTYVPSAPSPKAALALVERAGQLLDVPVDTTELGDAARSYEAEVSELVDEDEETAEYVRQIEERYDEEPQLFVEDVADSSSLVEEVERFLRDQD
jgi:predicted ATP-grasp superfamily ATP-dependent carboligase